MTFAIRRSFYFKLTHKPMFATIINDCRDANAFGRQAARVSALLSCPVSTVGVHNDIEAGGMLVDILDASLGKKSIILVNVAPREKTKNKWENGTPFGYFRVGETIVCASIAGETMRLVHALGITSSIEVFDIPTVVAEAVQKNLLTTEEAVHITNTQFRSFEFLPRIATWITQGHTFTTDTVSLDTYFAKTNHRIWWVDCFGNCKTTILADTTKQTIETPWGTLPVFGRLTDVPDQTLAIVSGSSGYGTKRLFEIMIQGGNAAQKCTITSGQEF